MAGKQQALMKAQVVADIVATFENSALHAGKGRFDVVNVMLRGALRCQPDRRRLNDQAQVLQVAHKFGRQASAGLPGDHIRVKPVPLVAGLHPGANLGAGQDQALSHQRLHSLPHHSSTDAQLSAQQRFRRQGTSGPEAPHYNGLSQIVDRIAVYVFHPRAPAKAVKITAGRLTAFGDRTVKTARTTKYISSASFESSQGFVYHMMFGVGSDFG